MLFRSPNTTGVTDIMEVTPKFLAEQLGSIFTDINPDAIKTGMVSSSELIETIADKLTEYHAKNIVVDPVMVATSGARLISEEAIGTFHSSKSGQSLNTSTSALLKSVSIPLPASWTVRRGF